MVVIEEAQSFKPKPYFPKPNQSATDNGQVSKHCILYNNKLDFV